MSSAECSFAISSAAGASHVHVRSLPRDGVLAGDGSAFICCTGLIWRWDDKSVHSLIGVECTDCVVGLRVPQDRAVEALPRKRSERKSG